MTIVRTSAVAALVLAGGMFGGNVAVAGQQQEPGAVADELLTRAVHAERSYRGRLERLQRLRDHADEQGETDRVAEFEALLERSRVEHAGKVKRMRGRMSREMLERFDARIAEGHPGRGLALGHQIGNRGEAAGKAALRQELRRDFWHALAKRHAVESREARVNDHLEQWKQRAQDRREHRQDARKQHRQDRQDARHDRRQDRRETKNDHRRDRRDAKHERRDGRRDARHERRDGRRDAKHERRNRRDRARGHVDKRSDRTLRRRAKPQVRRKDTPRTPAPSRPDQE